MIPSPHQLARAQKSRRRAVYAFAGGLGSAFTYLATFIAGHVADLPAGWHTSLTVAQGLAGFLGLALASLGVMWAKDSGAGQIPEKDSGAGQIPEKGER